MEIGELITTLREDYLDDVFEGWESATDDEKEGQFLWSDAFLIRSLSEAQKQACNRTDFLYDDSSKITKITLIDGQSTYSIDPLITFVEYAGFDGEEVELLSKHELQRQNAQWRTLTGMTGNKVYCIMRGHSVRFVPAPNSTDNGKIVSLEVYHLPKEPIESSGDDLVIPEEYQRDLIWWVLYEAFSKPDTEVFNPEKGKGYLKMFTDIFGESVSSEVRMNQYNQRRSLIVRPVAYTNDFTTDDNEF